MLKSQKTKMKKDENPKKFCWLGPVMWSCYGLFKLTEGNFFPPSLSLMAAIETRCEEEEFERDLLKKWALASIFPAQPKRLTLLKNSTSASGLGVGGARKGRFITFQKFKLKVGIFGINSRSPSSREDESWQLSNDGLFSGRHTDITKDRKGNGMKRRPL